MAHFILSFSAFLIIASFNLPESQCLEKPEKELLVAQSLERRNEATRNELQAGEPFAKTSNVKLEDDGRSLSPREVGFWQQQVLNRLPALANFVIGQIPSVFRFIYQKCLSSEGEGYPVDSEAVVCMLDEVLNIFPSSLTGSLAKIVVIDIVKKKGQDIYTPENVLSIAAMCGEFIRKPTSQPSETAPNIFFECFYDAVKAMHPLQQYALAALQRKASGFFDSIAKTCHDDMPRELSDRREMGRYYLKCFIDTASADYQDNWLVKFGLRRLEPYINNPDAKFNKEKILDIAELCEDRTKSLPPEFRNTVVFFCFFRNILSLHPRTKRIADFLMIYSGNGGTITDDRPKTNERLFSGVSNGRSNSPISRTPSRINADNNNPQRQKELIDCVSRALTSAFLRSLTTSSFTGFISSVPGTDGLFQNSNLTPISIARSFATTATPCFTLFSRDEDGNLFFDRNYAMNTVKEAAKWNPARALAVDAAEALAENVTVKYYKVGSPQYNFNYQNLATWLAKAALNFNNLDRSGSKSMLGK